MLGYRVPAPDEAMLISGSRYGLKEAPGGVGDRREVVADLEDHHALEPERDALVGDAGLRDLRLLHGEREVPGLAEAGHDERAVAGDHPERRVS